MVNMSVNTKKNRFTFIEVEMWRNIEVLMCVDYENDSFARGIHVQTSVPISKLFLHKSG